MPGHMANMTALVKRWVEENILYSFTDVTIAPVLSIRKRFTIAQVNAGVTLLAAIPNFGYRMISANAIAVGGAVTTVTTVDILATLTSSRKLVAFAQAGLTRSTVLRDGDSSSAVLADGASYTRNDANTAITANITGSAITVATHVDIIFEYAIEKV